MSAVMKERLVRHAERLRRIARDLRATDRDIQVVLLDDYFQPRPPVALSTELERIARTMEADW